MSISYKNQKMIIKKDCKRWKESGNIIVFANLPELEEIYGKDVIFTRPYELFIESVTVDGVETPRFQFIKL